MAFIRENTLEKTGYQNGAPLLDCIDNACDFVMVYRWDESTVERIRAYREKGYVIHLMTGIAWGNFLDYLNGKYDGNDHWDEAQTDRFGNQIMHGNLTPYMVPTVSFADYISETLKKAVDAGVEAIHVEEPEFWDRAEYSKAFQREYEAYYKTKWIPPHESVDARFKCAKLKQYLYTRTIDRVSSFIKAYSLKKYGKAVRFYVPTHSLINYTQWKIVSPEGKLADLPYVDGCIAQVWTGTSREKNWYAGRYAERTFETAFLEYGVMQELVKNTGRRMWFLHDPIEDNPAFDWEDYKKNYLCTVTASLLHPGINDYEICPWPARVFTGAYPKNDPGATTIPEEYSTILNNMFQTLGDIPVIDEKEAKIGIVTADAQLYQRTYPDPVFSKAEAEKTGTVLVEDESLIRDFQTKLTDRKETDAELLLKYMQSAAFPAFYSLALPLVKSGVPIRPVLLDNVRRYPGYLDDYRVLIVSYEYLKPEYPDMNMALASWVRQGGILLYVGNGFDPYHEIKSWWTGKYRTPAEHLFELLDISPQEEKSVFTCGKGIVGVWTTNPCQFSYSEKLASDFRDFFHKTVSEGDFCVSENNHLLLRRGKYLIAAVMDESIQAKPLVLHGNFADMYSPDFTCKKEVALSPGQNCLLCDLDKISDKTAVIGTSVRILSLTNTQDEISLTIRGASDFTAYIRLKVPFAINKAILDGVQCDFDYNAENNTLLLRFKSVTGERSIVLSKS